MLKGWQSVLIVSLFGALVWALMGHSYQQIWLGFCILIIALGALVLINQQGE